MSSEKYTAICLSAIDYRESDKLLTLYCKGKGKITATLRGCKSPKSKLKIAGSPLVFGEYEFSVTRGRYIVTGISDVEMFESLWTDFDKFYIGMSMLEIFNKFTYENEIYDDLFLEVLKGLDALNAGVYMTEQVTARFLYDIISSAGYEPCLDACIKCGDTSLIGKKFSYINGGLVCPECGNGISLKSDVLSIFCDFCTLSEDEYYKKSYKRTALLNVIFVFSKYLEHIFGEKVKSLCQFLDNLCKNT